MFRERSGTPTAHIIDRTSMEGFDDKEMSTGMKENSPARHRSVTSLENNSEAIMESLTERLEEEVKGQSRESITARFQGIYNAINSINLVSSGVGNKGGKKETDMGIGMKVCQGVERMFKQAAPVLETMIVNDINVHELIEARRYNQALFQMKIKELEEGLGEPVDKPELEEMNMLVKVRMNQWQRTWESEARQRSTATGKGKPQEATKPDEALRAEKEAELVAELYPMYLQSKSDYKDYERKVKYLEKKKKECADDINREILMANMLSYYANLIKLVCNKIKNAISECSAIRTVLSQRVSLRVHKGKMKTLETVGNPYAEEHVSAMWQVLSDKYHKPTFSNFNKALLEAISLSVPADAPGGNALGMKRTVEKLVSVWESMTYWDYMNSDVFWTAVLVNGLTEGDARDKIQMELTEFLWKREAQMLSGESPDEEDKQHMPIFTHISQYIDMIVESKVIGPRGKASGLPAGGRDQVARPEGQRQPAAGRYGYQLRNTQQQGTEQAAVADARATGGGSEGGGGTLPQPKFAREVTPDDKVSNDHVNAQGALKRALYTATSVACVNCQHVPRCYTGRACSRCLLYGHTHQYCRQVISGTKSGAPQPQQTTGRPAQVPQSKKMGGNNFAALADEYEEEEG